MKGPLRHIGMPDGMLVGAIIRDGEVMIPGGDAQVRPGDGLIALVTYRALRKVEAMLAGTARDANT